MFRPFTGSRPALMLRRLRGRFGISAPRLAIRTHVPWYWRALSVVALSAVSLALAGWIYDAGRRFAGFEQSESAQEITEMRSRLVQLESELDAARKVANASESRLRIESTTQEMLSAQIKTMEEENTRLKADLAMFENLAGGQAGELGLTINRLQVIPEGDAGQYRYRLLLAQSGERRNLEFKGALQFVVTVRQGGETAMMQIPSANDSGALPYQISFRYFRRLEGTFTVAPGAQVQRVEARLVQGGMVRASQSVTL